MVVASDPSHKINVLVSERGKLRSPHLHGLGDAQVVVGESSDNSFVPPGQFDDKTGGGVTQRHNGKAVIMPVNDQARTWRNRHLNRNGHSTIKTRQRRNRETGYDVDAGLSTSFRTLEETDELGDGGGRKSGWILDENVRRLFGM